MKQPNNQLTSIEGDALLIHYYLFNFFDNLQIIRDVEIKIKIRLKLTLKQN